MEAALYNGTRDERNGGMVWKKREEVGNVRRWDVEKMRG